MNLQKTKLSPQRWAAFIVGGIAILLFALQVSGRLWLGILAGTGFFLGITDYGRRCPLLISAHHLLARLRKKDYNYKSMFFFIVP